MNDIVLLDSNAIIGLLDGDRSIARTMARAARIMVPAIVCGEIEAGTQGETKREKLMRRTFEDLLSMEQVSVLPVSRKTGQYYARLFVFLKGNGTPIPTNDIWIAASVLEAGGVLLTNDRHFNKIPLIRTMSF